MDAEPPYRLSRSISDRRYLLGGCASTDKPKAIAQLSADQIAQL